MPPKINSLKLNKLQLKTLVLFQELARSPSTSTKNDETGEVLISWLPQPHGNHFHVGTGVVMAADASGFKNEAVWKALERKGLIKSQFPVAAIITAAGLEYQTGMRDKIIHHSDH